MLNIVHGKSVMNIKNAIIDTMMAQITEDVFESFLHGAEGDWFQMFTDGRVMIGSLPVITIECGLELSFQEFQEMIRKQLKDFIESREAGQ